MPEALLRAEGLTVVYGRAKAVQGIDLEIAAGEAVALLGANGAGKSSTLLALSGLIPSGGRIVFSGRDIRGMRPDHVVRLGLVQVPEVRAIFPALTVEENLSVAEHLRRRDPSLAEDRNLLADVLPRLGALRKRLAGSLSGGEQQMLAIGKALLSRPKLLLVDELSLGLAPKVTSELFEVLDLIHGRGTAVLLVEQFLPFALRLADRIYVLEKGRVTQTGPSEQFRGGREQLAGSYLGRARRG